MPLNTDVELSPLPIENTHIRVQILEANNSRVVALGVLSISLVQKNDLFSCKSPPPDAYNLYVLLVVHTVVSSKSTRRHLQNTRGRCALLNARLPHTNVTDLHRLQRFNLCWQ